LKREGVKEVDVEALYEYYNGAFPTVIKEAERQVTPALMPEQKPPQQPQPAPTPKPISQVRVASAELLHDGKPNDWLLELDNLVANGARLKLPPGYHGDKRGYRSLILALLSYMEEKGTYKLKSCLDDKSLKRAAELLDKIANREELSVDPASSDKVDMDNILSVLCGGRKPELEVKEKNKRVFRYEFTDAKGNTIVVRKTILLDPRGFAKRIVYARE
jgi:hypothetical protein